MQISDLVEESGVPRATVKYYLREGLLPPGTPTSVTRASYGEAHVRRLGLIRALTGAGGLPLSQVKQVLAVIDDPSTSLIAALGEAVRVVSPNPEAAEGETEEEPDVRQVYPKAMEKLLGSAAPLAPGNGTARELAEALRAIEGAGLPLSDDRLLFYASHVRAIAEEEMRLLPQVRSQAVEYAVLGTTLYEPVISAMRKLAHQQIALHLPEQQ